MIKREKTPQSKKAAKPARTVKSAKPARKVNPEKKAKAPKTEKALQKPAVTAIQADSAAIQEEICERAHQLFLERGDREGDALSDWLQAEREIKKKYNLT